MTIILDAQAFGNSIEIKLALTPSQIIQIANAIEDITDYAAKARRNAMEQARQERRVAQGWLLMIGLKIERLSRKSGIPLTDAASIVARQQSMTHEQALALAKRAVAHVKYRYMRRRNITICRMAADETPYGAISRRYGLTKGRVAQIVKTKGATLQ